MPDGISAQRIASMPLAVVDVETTGLVAGADKIVEIAVVRIEPGVAPRLVLDTMVNPGQRVTGTEYHGLTDADVHDAPRLKDVAPNITAALDGAVVASYNVYFDMRFLSAELAESGVAAELPHLCLMYMRPMLGLGKKTNLVAACEEHGVERFPHHRAGADAMAAAGLWSHYAAAMTKSGVVTFQELGRLKKYKFVSSFGASVHRHAHGSPDPARLRPRPLKASEAAIDAAAVYWDALLSVVADLEFSEEEVVWLQQLQRKLNIPGPTIRFLHGTAFAGVLSSFAHDQVISDDEAVVLHRLARALRRAGWAPGDAPAPAPQRGWLRSIFG